MLYLMIVSFGQHFPSIVGLHSFSVGEHWIYVDRAPNPRVRLIEMIRTQMRRLIQPSEIRSTVIANEVLLHIAASMEKNPLVLEMRRKAVRSVGWKSQMCLP